MTKRGTNQKTTLVHKIQTKKLKTQQHERIVLNRFYQHTLISKVKSGLKHGTNIIISLHV